MKGPQHVSPEMIELAYEFLRSTKPFKGWRLPDPDDVEFRAVKIDWYADMDWRKGRPLLRVSYSNVGYPSTLLKCVAHEMVHMYLDRKGVRREHREEFQAAAALVCRYHGFDPKDF